MDEKQSDRHGGPVHKFWVETVAKHLEAKGLDVRKEVPVGGGKTIDIVAMRNGGKTAFEIETGKSDAKANVDKCIEAGFEKVVVVATSATAKATLSKAISQDNHVALQTASEALE